MFHTKRPSIHVRPASEPAEDKNVTEAAPVAAETSIPAEPAPQMAQSVQESTAGAGANYSVQPQTQPSEQKEAHVMSTYNNPNYNNDTNNDATAQGSAPQVPSTSTFAQPRAGMPMARSPYGYGQPYGATQSPAAEPAMNTGRKLVIGEGITLSGEIEACDHLVVEGTVEASLKGASILDVSQSGMFFGAVEINEATIAGRFEGDLVVNGRLTVRATGTITGTLSYKELAVEAGATIDGKINPNREGRVVTAEKKPQVTLGSSKKPQGEAGSELFTNKAVAAAE